MLRLCYTSLPVESVTSSFLAWTSGRKTQLIMLFFENVELSEFSFECYQIGFQVWFINLAETVTICIF